MAEYPKEIYRALRTLDKHFKTTDPQYYVAAILMASVTQGANVDLIANYLKWPLADVALVASRFWANGVWKGTELAADWVNPKNDGMGFWLDMQVGAGLLERGRRADGEIAYKMNEQGVKYVETKMLKRMR